jgi:hypothetical protein
MAIAEAKASLTLRSGILLLVCGVHRMLYSFRQLQSETGRQLWTIQMI